MKGQREITPIGYATSQWTRGSSYYNAIDTAKYEIHDFRVYNLYNMEIGDVHKKS